MSGFHEDYPVPQITALTKPFWDACTQGRLSLQRCDRCGRLRFYPSESCPDCRSTEYTWTGVSGFGKVHSWTVVHRSVDPVWQALAPFVTGIIEIDEQQGCLMPGLILGVDPSGVRDGMPVVVEFERTGDATMVPRWRAA